MPVRKLKTKNPIRKIKKVEVKEVDIPTTPVVVEEKTYGSRWMLYAGAVAALVIFWWWRTGTWPIVGFVNYKPILRFSVDQELYKQFGTSTVDSIATEMLIRDELADKKINVTADQVGQKLDDVKKSIGSDEAYQQALAMQGMSEDQLKGQIKMQIGLEELVKSSTDSASATDAAYMSQAVYKLVTDLKGKGKVWLVK